MSDYVDPYGDHLGPGETPAAPEPAWGVASGRSAPAPGTVQDVVANAGPMPAGQRTYPVPGEAEAGG